MAMHLDDLETAYVAVNQEPLSGAWIRRGSNEIRFVADLTEVDAPPAADDQEWVTMPTPEDLHVRIALAESFVQQYCPHLAEPINRCFGRRGPWHAYLDMLDTNGYLEIWRRFEDQGIRDALSTWAEEHDIALAS